MRLPIVMCIVGCRMRSTSPLIDFCPLGHSAILCTRTPISSDLDRRNAICDPPHVVTVARNRNNMVLRVCQLPPRGEFTQPPSKWPQSGPSNLPILFLAAREEETLCTCTPLVLSLLSTTLLYLFSNAIPATTGSCKKVPA